MLLLLKIFICIFQLLIKIKNYRNNLVNDSIVKWSDAWYKKNMTKMIYQIWKMDREEEFSLMYYADFAVGS